MKAPNRLSPKVLKVTLFDYETVSHDDCCKCVDSQILSELLDFSDRNHGTIIVGSHPEASELTSFRKTV